MREPYKRRRDVLVESFGRAGWDIPPPQASMFAWAPLPEPFKTIGTVDFATLLIEKAELAVSPGIGFGEHGEGFVRIALVENEQRIRQAARNLRRCLETRAGKVAQRRSPRQAPLIFRRRRQVAKPMIAPLRVGLAGLGTVGAAVIELIDRERGALAARCGREIEVVAVTARSKAKKRPVD